MKNKLLLIMIIFLFSENAFSANSYFRNRMITGAGVYYSGANSILIININGDKTGMTKCADTGRFAINSTVPHYKEIVSLVFAAYLSGQASVDLYVTDTCTYFGNAQDILSIKMGDIPW